jgi:hypothetical protein
MRRSPRRREKCSGTIRRSSADWYPLFDRPSSRQPPRVAARRERFRVSQFDGLARVYTPDHGRRSGARDACAGRLAASRSRGCRCKLNFSEIGPRRNASGAGRDPGSARRRQRGCVLVEIAAAVRKPASPRNWHLTRAMVVLRLQRGTSKGNEPPERSEPAKRRASEGVGGKALRISKGECAPRTSPRERADNRCSRQRQTRERRVERESVSGSSAFAKATADKPTGEAPVSASERRERARRTERAGEAASE